MTDPLSPEDRALAEAFEALDPTPAQVARMRGRVNAELDGHRTSLVRAWLDLLRLRPVAHLSWVAAAAAVLLVTSPAAALVGAALRGLGTPAP